MIAGYAPPREFSMVPSKRKRCGPNERGKLLDQVGDALFGLKKRSPSQPSPLLSGDVGAQIAKKKGKI